MPEQTPVNISRQVRRVIADVADVTEEKLSGTTELVKDLQMDSLALYELVIELEEIYKLQISDEDIERIKSIDEIIDYIAGRMKPERK
ncbi:MAG: acyl carrier protein [Ruminococcaceae bacterium]|jgi:acyl carrier protein|nr:acyl carrier protein [Oscillospiraceae bacterium]